MASKTTHLMRWIYKMIRLLDGLVLLKEVDEIDGIKHNSNQLKKMYPEKVIVIRHNSYIYKNVLCSRAQEKITELDNYIQLGALSENMSITKKQFLQRLKFMEKTGIKIFDYIMVSNVYFIRLDTEFKYLFQNYIPFVANYGDADNLVHCRMLGDLKIGFY